MADQAPSPAPSSSGKNIGMAVVAYFIFFIPLLTEDKKDPYVMYHVKQGLITTIFYVGLGVIQAILLLPLLFIWWIWWVLWVILVVIWLIGIINAATGKQKPVPIIGKIGESFKF